MLLPPPGLTVLAGEYGCRKTLLALDLAVCVALGQPWLGLPVAQSPVLYVDDELGERQFMPRARAALLGYHAGVETPIHVTSSGFSALRLAPLAAQAAKVSAKFIVIDPMPHLLRANTNLMRTSLPTMLRNLRQLADVRHLSILVTLHATRRGLRRALAPLSILASSVLSLQRTRGQLHLQSLTPASPQLDLHAVINSSFDATWLSPAPSSPVQLTAIQSSILVYLYQRGPSSIRSLTHATQATVFRITKAIYRLRTAGLVSRADPGLRGQTAAYALTPRGQAQAEACQVHTRTPCVSRDNNFSIHPSLSTGNRQLGTDPP